MKPNFLYVAGSPLSWGQGLGPSGLMWGLAQGKVYPAVTERLTTHQQGPPVVTQAEWQAKDVSFSHCFPFIMKREDSSLLTKAHSWSPLEI